MPTVMDWPLVIVGHIADCRQSYRLVIICDRPITFGRHSPRPDGIRAGRRQSISSSRPGPTARRPIRRSSAHIITWLALSTGLPSQVSSGAITS